MLPYWRPCPRPQLGQLVHQRLGVPGAHRANAQVLLCVRRVGVLGAVQAQPHQAQRQRGLYTLMASSVRQAVGLHRLQGIRGGFGIRRAGNAGIAAGACAPPRWRA